jgi:pimeloyl-ACP methyl ester carboxylesterase
MAVETGFAEINDARIYYEVAGRDAPLVFVHGYALDCRMWDDQFDDFADRYRVVRYDIRGFGRSDPPTAAPYSNHDDLRRLLDLLGIDRAHVCGLSMGGGIAIDFALEHPERVGSLVLISSALGGSTRGLGSMTDTVMAMIAAGNAGDLPEAKRLWLESPLFAPANRDAGVAARLRHMVGNWSGWQLTNEANHVDPDPLPALRLADLVCPTLVTVGELDSEVVHAVAVDIEKGAPNASRVVVPDAGHMANMEAPAAVNAHIADFLAK